VRWTEKRRLSKVEFDALSLRLESFIFIIISFSKPSRFSHSNFMLMYHILE